MMASNLIVVERSLFKGMREVLDERVEIVQVFRRGSFFWIVWISINTSADALLHVCLLFIGCEVYLCMLADIVCMLADIVGVK